MYNQRQWQTKTILVKPRTKTSAYASSVLSLSNTIRLLSATTGLAMSAAFAYARCIRGSIAHSVRWADGSALCGAFVKLTVLSQALQPKLIFTTSPDRLYADFDAASIKFTDPKLSILFETQEAMEDSLILLRFNCPDLTCDFVASGWNELKSHTRAAHGMLIWCAQSTAVLRSDSR